MKKYQFILLALTGTLLFTGCDLKNDSEYEEKLVLEGVMVVNGPLSVRITKTVSIYQHYDNSQLGVSDADVRIRADGREFILPEDTSHPGTYALPLDSHIVTSGMSYEFRAIIGETVITAISDAAPAPLVIDSTNLSQWSDSLAMDTVEFGRKIGDIPWNIYAHWNGDARNDGYAFIFENLEPDWFEEYRELSGNANGGAIFNYSVWTLRNMTEFNFPWLAFSCTGRHRIRILSCNRVAYDYNFTTMPGDPEADPNSNVQGALGVFCAVGADTAYFYLKDDIED